MSILLDQLEKFDFRKWAVVSLGILWAGTAFAPALMQVAFVFALIFWGAGLIKDRITASAIREIQPWRLDRALWVSLALFYILVVVSFFTSEYPKESLRGLWKITMPVLIFVMSGDLFRGGKPQKQFMMYFIVTCLIVTADSAIQYAFGRDLLRHFPAQDSNAGLRLVGPFGDFGKMGAYLVLVIPVLMMRGWNAFAPAQPPGWGKFRPALFPIILAAASLILLYLTRTRGALLAMVISLFCLFVHKRWFKVLGIVLLLCCALLAVTPRGVIIHQDSQGKEQSIVERFELWKRALDVIEAKPWTGTGINTYNVAHEKYDKEKNWRVRGYYAHNGYLQLAAETGIF